MSNEYVMTILVFKSLSEAMRVLRRSLIALDKSYKSRLHSITLQATPAVTSVPPHAFSFFLDAELPEATTTGQAWLGLALEVKVEDDAYWVDGSIGWNRQKAVGAATPSPWDHLECPEWRSTSVTVFFEGLPGYVQELVSRYERALGEYLESAAGVTSTS